MKIFQIGLAFNGGSIIHKIFRNNDIKSIDGCSDQHLGNDLYENFKSSHSIINGFTDYEAFCNMQVNDHKSFDYHKKYLNRFISEYPDALFIYNHIPMDEYLEVKKKAKNGKVLESNINHYQMEEQYVLNIWRKQRVIYEAELEKMFPKSPYFVKVDLTKDESIKDMLNFLSVWLDIYDKSIIRWENEG